MGFVPLSQEFLLRHVPSLNGIRMMELGNQQLYCHPGIPEGSSAKPWFERQGVDHTSVDMNGKDGAVVVDLSQPIENPAWNSSFDVVTDFGTTEHVGPKLWNLYSCRENCHRWCRTGGVMVFMNPKTGHWPKHGYHYFTMAHYHALAKACAYDVLEISEHPSLGNDVDGWQVHAAFKKTGVPFVSFDQFSTLCRDTIFQC